MNNKIKELGCEFLSKILVTLPEPMVSIPLLKLKLDNNPIGTEGLRILTQGLAINSTIERLSLNYCQIDEFGAKYL